MTKGWPKGKSRNKPPANKGKIMSVEQRLKISNSLKGKPSPRKGVTLTDDTKIKVANARRGVTLSFETRQKISKANKGKTVSQETRLKISNARKGIIFSEDTCRKISKARKGQTPSINARKNMSKGQKDRAPATEATRLKISKAHKGRKRSEEAKRNMSIAKQKWFDDPANADKLPLALTYKQGIYQSTKIPKGSLRWIASYELMYLNILDNDPKVLWYDTAIKHIKPIPYVFDGKDHKYLPDFIVHYWDHWEIHEVKPKWYVHNDPITMAKKNAAVLLYGNNYKFITESELGV